MLSSQVELLQLYIKDLKAHGYNASTLICTTNRQCGILTNIIRPALGIDKSTLTVNDLLLVTQNNLISGLMNGDLVKVTEIGDVVIRRAGLTFTMVSVMELFTKKSLFTTHNHGHYLFKPYKPLARATKGAVHRLLHKNEKGRNKAKHT